MLLPTTPERSKNMQAIHSKDTKIEVKLRKALYHAGIRYRKNVKVLNCHPDIVIKKYKLAIFCDGDFWHGKDYDRYAIKNNRVYWDEKIKRNKERDLENTIALRDAGWTVFRFWEEEINGKLEECVSVVVEFVCSKRKN
ncbi:MAG: very short patch repair endonuclease [Phascolarctobacterium sp.]|nr:very short patch repair endonuclease [Phascolarctobacterium sp.]